MPRKGKGSKQYLGKCDFMHTPEDNGTAVKFLYYIPSASVSKVCEYHFKTIKSQKVLAPLYVPCKKNGQLISWWKEVKK